MGAPEIFASNAACLAASHFDGAIFLRWARDRVEIYVHTCTSEKLVYDVLFLEVLVISCIIAKKNVTFVMRSLLK